MAAFEWKFTTDCLYQGDVATFKCFEPLFKNLVSTVLALAGVGLFVMLVVGGFSFLLSGGDQKKLDGAKGTVTHAILGLVIIVSAYLILRTIEIFTGVPLTKFEVNIK